MRFFEGQSVVAFISDRAMDFQPTDFDAPLTLAQSAYLKQECGVDVSHVFWRRQIHGDDILVAQDSSYSSKGCPDADAYITSQKNLPLAIRTADCVPVFLFDAVKGVIGLAHAGWKGTAKQITHKTVEQMQQKCGSNPKDIKAVLGPAIQSCCYQVGIEFREHFPEDVIERNGHLYADVSGNNYKQLLKAGLLESNITNTKICTCCNPQYFSFRRDAAQAGRMISLMMLR